MSEIKDSNDTNTWPDLSIWLYDRLTGRGAHINYTFDNLKVQGLLFMIRTFVINIEELDKEQKNSIINSIEGMNADELIYKGLSEKTKYNNVISLLDN